MKAKLLRTGRHVGEARHIEFDVEHVRFATPASLMLGAYELELPSGAIVMLRVVSIARDGRGPRGQQTPGCARVTGVRDGAGLRLQKGLVAA